MRRRATPKWIKVPRRASFHGHVHNCQRPRRRTARHALWVFILLPVVLLTVAIVAAVGLARESGAWRILLEIVVVMAALELGIWRKRGGPNPGSRKSPGALGEDQSNGHPAPTENEARQPRILGGGQRLGNVN